MVATAYSNVEWVDYSETFARTVPATSSRLVAAMVCELDGDLRHLGVDQAFIQSKLNTGMYLHLPTGCGSISGNALRPKKAVVSALNQRLPTKKLGGI
ncbi:unnamed protein product [Sphacelaria rigidula]